MCTVTLNSAQYILLMNILDKESETISKVLIEAEQTRNPKLSDFIKNQQITLATCEDIQEILHDAVERRVSQNVR